MFLFYFGCSLLIIISNNWHQEVFFAQGVVRAWNPRDGTPVVKRYQDV